MNFELQPEPNKPWCNQHYFRDKSLGDEAKVRMAKFKTTAHAHAHYIFLCLLSTDFACALLVDLAHSLLSTDFACALSVDLAHSLLSTDLVCALSVDLAHRQ